MNHSIPERAHGRLTADLREGRPEMSETQLVDTEERLRQYAQVVIEIIQGIGDDPEKLRRLDLSILEIRVRELATEDNQIGIRGLKRGHRRPFLHSEYLA